MASMWYAYRLGCLPNLSRPKNVNELWISINLKARKNTKARALRIQCATKESMDFLEKNSIIPVLVRGGKNYQWEGYIDRECIDNIVI